MVEIQNLLFRYESSSDADFVLQIEDLKIKTGERVAIVGPSGSGKTTLLNLISGIEIPGQGEVLIDGESVSHQSDTDRRQFRISKIGMVFQRFELIEYLTALDNILLPFLINRSAKSDSSSQELAQQLADQMGLAGKLSRYPHQLSQGEQQRVAICRAMVNKPKMILADEPTGNLDPKNKLAILELLFNTCRQQDQTLLVVTHDVNILDGFDRVIDFEKFTIPTGVA